MKPKQEMLTHDRIKYKCVTNGGGKGFVTTGMEVWERREVFFC